MHWTSVVLEHLTRKVWGVVTVALSLPKKEHGAIPSAIDLEDGSAQWIYVDVDDEDAAGWSMPFGPDEATPRSTRDALLDSDVLEFRGIGDGEDQEEPQDGFALDLYGYGSNGGEQSREREKKGSLCYRWTIFDSFAQLSAK